LVVIFGVIAASLQILSGQIDTQVKHFLSAVNGSCVAPDKDVEYLTGRSLYQLHIANPALCSTRCGGDEKCGAWTWGKLSWEQGLTETCFLKEVHLGQVLKKRARHGFVSGLPCRCPDNLKGTTPCSVSWHDALRAAADSDRVTTPAPGAALLARRRSTTTTMSTIVSLTTTSNGTTPESLFCWSLMIPDSYEQKLLVLQHHMNLSIFACDGYTVYSNSVIEVVPGINTHAVDSDLKCKYGGKYDTALNTDIFLAVWSKVRSEGDFRHFAWTLKSDPDTVFFPGRLRLILREHEETDQGVYLNNCKYGLHGPIELFSLKAVEALTAGEHRCRKHLCKGQCDWGEDMFIDKCLDKVLGVRRDNVYDMLFEDHCDPPKGWDSCRENSRVAFHPFKDVDRYRWCAENAMPTTLQG